MARIASSPSPLQRERHSENSPRSSELGARSDELPSGALSFNTSSLPTNSKGTRTFGPMISGSTSGPSLLQKSAIGLSFTVSGIANVSHKRSRIQREFGIRLYDPFVGLMCTIR